MDILFLASCPAPNKWGFSSYKPPLSRSPQQMSHLAHSPLWQGNGLLCETLQDLAPCKTLLPVPCPIHSFPAGEHPGRDQPLAHLSPCILGYQEGCRCSLGMQMNAELTTVSEGESTIHLRGPSNGRDNGQRGSPSSWGSHWGCW